MGRLAPFFYVQSLTENILILKHFMVLPVQPFNARPNFPGSTRCLRQSFFKDHLGASGPSPKANHKPSGHDIVQMTYVMKSMSCVSSTGILQVSGAPGADFHDFSITRSSWPSKISLANRSCTYLFITSISSSVSPLNRTAIPGGRSRKSPHIFFS